MTADIPMSLNQAYYCRPVNRNEIIKNILAQNAAPDMDAMLADRLHYFANTSVFLSSKNLSNMMSQIQAIEDVVKRPAYIDHVRTRALPNSYFADDQKTKGVFMGYDFHITNTGPKLIEINSNAGGAFIVNMIEESRATASGDFAAHILDMFRSEWKQSGREETLKTLAIVDENPASQYHYPDMCLAKSILEGRGIDVVITDPKDLDLRDGALFHGKLQIDVVYNRLTDFSFNAPEN